MKENKLLDYHKILKEIQTMFNCARCSKWWLLNNIPLKKKTYYCPWCGHKGHIKDISIGI